MALLVYLIFHLFSCTQVPQQKLTTPQILEDLKLNYTQYYDDMEGVHDLYFEFYSIASKAEHDTLAARYKQAVQAFYRADKKIIDDLLRFEGSRSYNEWLFIGKSPLSSDIKETDFILETEAALILIDYYLRGKWESIDLKSKPKKLTYPTFRQFYELNKNKSLKQLRWLYGWEF